MPNHSRPTAAAWCEIDAASASEQSTERLEWVQSKESGAAIHRPVFPAFRQQISSYLLAQRPQGVQLLVVDLRTAMHAGFGDLGEPFRAIALCVYFLTCAGIAQLLYRAFKRSSHVGIAVNAR